MVRSSSGTVGNSLVSERKNNSKFIPPAIDAKGDHVDDCEFLIIWKRISDYINASPKIQKLSKIYHG